MPKQIDLSEDLDDEEEIGEDGQDDLEEGHDEGSDDAADEEGQEGGDQQEDPEEDEGQEGQVAKPSRASARVRAAVERAKTAETERQKLEREIAELRSQRSAPRESPEAEAQRMALMTTEERLDYKLAKAEALHNQRIQEMAYQHADATDKAEFRAGAAADKHRQKYIDKVETRLAEYRKQGMNVPRERLYTYLVGEDVLKGMKDTGKQRDTGKKNVQRQTVRPSSGRSDQGANRKSGKSLEERLSGVLL